MASCASDTTAANSFEKPNLYQACGGNRIHTAATETLIDTADTDATCCDSCTGSEYTMKCVLLLGMPKGAALTNTKRCEAVEKSTLMATSMLLTNNFDAQGYSGVTMLLSASALVALVTVKWRRASPNKQSPMDDAYYPLLN
uniref:Uncharacterized protein n=1 Tax=Globisporangium ultimum (strain ATCC 200006 / CBS 805.95 / DAOM BR144) TaxID=431595 RepID=K3WLN3_GLOUD